jgi:hypothetical protein
MEPRGEIGGRGAASRRRVDRRRGASARREPRVTTAWGRRADAARAIRVAAARGRRADAARAIRVAAARRRRPAAAWAIRGAAWSVVTALIVLASRALAYGLSAAPQAPVLEQAAGGPRMPIVALVSGVLGLGGACAALWLASLGVRERRLLEGRALEREPRLRLKPVLPRAAALFVATSLAFALLESTIHWRAGLGWHGLGCLVGPVHRDAIPILAALSVVASALAAALELVVAWMRRTFAALTARPRPATRPAPPVRPRHATPFAREATRTHGARGPPLIA